MPVDLAPPIIRQHRMAEGFGMQRIRFIILERTAPFEGRLIVTLCQRLFPSSTVT
jgi:hypothetical protein